MQTKEKQHLSRVDVAARLRQIADAIEEGSIKVGGMAVNIPDDMQYELELEERADHGEFEIELEWKR